MNNKLITIIIIATGVFVSCNTHETKTEETNEHKDSITQSTPMATDNASVLKQDWEKFETDADTKIKQNEDSIQAFNKRIEKENTKMKNKYNKQIANLKEKNEAMKVRLANYKEDSNENFEKFKTDFNSGMDTLGTDIKVFFTRDSK